MSPKISSHLLLYTPLFIINMNIVMLSGLIMISACTSAPSSTVSSIALIESQGVLSLDAIPLSAVKSSGKKLMDRSIGLHWLTPIVDSSSTPQAVSVLIHGFKSQGYEWIYALHQRHQVEKTSFYRWDWEQCPQPAGERLRQTLEKLSQENPHRTINAFGHSYGGVILAVAAAQYRGEAHLNAHMIAAPLAGHTKLEARCAVKIPALIRFDSFKKTSHIHLSQWRTIHKIDGAFKSIPIDPQVLALPGEITRLPKTYKGRRLGHNWSISWVIDEVKAQKNTKLKTQDTKLKDKNLGSKLGLNE